MKHSLSDIKNPWIRRPLVVVFAPFAIALILLLSAMAKFTDWVDDEVGGPLRKAWNGEANIHCTVNMSKTANKGPVA